MDNLGGAGQFSGQQPRQRESILWQEYSALHGIYTHLCGAKQRYGVSSARITAPAGHTWEQGLAMCFSGHAESASSSSQHPQIQSGHRFSITDTFCNFSISFFEVVNVSDSAVAFPFLLARFLSLAFQGGSLCLFLSPYVLNNCRAKKCSHYFGNRTQI